MAAAKSTDAVSDVTIIGAGIVGVVCANMLCRNGYSVTLVDARAPGLGCSYGNGGAITPDACVPFALPGILSKIPGWLLRSDGPVSVDPTYLPRALPWLLRWLRAGRIDQARRSARAMRALHKSSLDMYRDLLGPDGFADLIRTTGHLYVYESDVVGKSEVLARALREEFGVRSNDVTAETIREMEPDLAPIYKRGTYFPDSAFTVNPHRLVDVLLAAFQRAGGTFVQSRVQGFDFGPTGPQALRLDTGELPVRKLVIAAGAWSHRLTAMLGSRVPLEAERGYHVMIPGSRRTLNHKIMNGTHMFGATAMEDGLQLTGTVEIAGVDAPPDVRRAKAILQLGRRMIPDLEDGEVTTWMGCRPSLPDSLPVLDRSPAFANVYFNFGHSHWGLSGAPMAAAVIAALIAGRPMPIDRRPYRVDRFRQIRFREPDCSA